jgi:hypothetical protein
MDDSLSSYCFGRVPKAKGQECNGWGYGPVQDVGSHINAKDKKVFRNLHLILMCIWISPYHIAAGLAKQQGSSYLELWWIPPDGLTTVQWGYWGCKQSKMAHTSLSYTHKVFHNLHMLWMCIWMSPYHLTARARSHLASLWKIHRIMVTSWGANNCKIVVVKTII